MIGRTISHYKILEKLGEGGMGVVYKAQDTKLKRAVALKFLASRALKSEQEKKRFMKEALAAAALDHPSICTIHEIDEVEGQTFIVMAYVEGQSLKERIESGALEIGEAISIVIQVAEGLQEAHDRGIVHRDIKSANIMVTDKGQAKIMDFGLARLGKDAPAGKHSTTMGTVAYMSPEQSRGEEVDHRTDIWSLGVVLYEAIAGQLPFKGEYEQAIMYSIWNEQPESLTRLRPGLPLELERIVNRALAKDVDARYQKAAEILADLRSLRMEFDSVAWGERPSIKRTPPSIAVLPFVNLSTDREQDYFCDGMAEEIINTLTHVEGLRVVARTSAFSFRGKNTDIREIGRRLNVGTILEGSVQKSGNRLRITSQLTSVADGYHLWSEKYDRDMGQLCCPEDIFGIQDEISLTIVNKLKVKLFGEEKAKLTKRHTEDLDAYGLYLKGRYFWNKRTEDSLKKAAGYFEQAIERDPGYALSHVGLADSHILLAEYSFVPPKEAFPKARSAVMKALSIDQTLAEARTSLAFIKTLSDWDWIGAEREFQQAIKFNPGYATAHQWYGEHLTMRGKWVEALEELQRAQELDPLSLVVGVALAVGVLCGPRQYDRVIEESQKVLELDPNFGGALNALGIAYREKAMYEEAIQAFRKARTFDEGNTWVRAGLGHAYAVSGKNSEAQEVLHELEQLSKRKYVPPDNIALVYLGLGEKDLTFEYLEKAYQDRCVGMPWLRADPVFDSLRSEPKFKALLERIGLEK